LFHHDGFEWSAAADCNWHLKGMILVGDSIIMPRRPEEVPGDVLFQQRRSRGWTTYT